MRKECNFRDLGGYITKDGRQVKQGMFYRSCCLAYMNKEELKELSAYDIKEVLDLRTSYEAYDTPDTPLPGAQYSRVSGMRDSKGEGIDFSPEGILRLQEQIKDNDMSLQKYMDHIYISMMFQNQGFLYLYELIKEHRFPILFHCATGKDRTGAVAMILLKALGVSDEDILKDYMLSNESFSTRIQADMQKHKAEIENDPLYRNKIIAADGVLLSNGQKMLDAVKKKYSADKDYFYKEYGLKAEDLKMIRNLFDC
jgi:protein-tyrosine phosphatase